MVTYNFETMMYTGGNEEVRIRRNELLDKYQTRPKGFTDYSAQFVRRHNPKFNIHLEGFFGGTCEKGSTAGCEAVCAEVVSSGQVWTGEADGTIRIWNAKTCKRINTTDQKKDVYCSSLLEVPGTDGSISVWAGFTDAVIRVFSSVHPYDVKLSLRRHGPGSKIHCLTPQIGGHCVFSGGQDGQIYQWDIRTHQCVNQFAGHRGGVRCLIADADILYSGSDDHAIAVWDIYGRDRVEWRGHTGSVLHLVKTDRHIWSGSEDETVRIWNIDTGECLSVLREPHCGIITAMNLVGDKVWTSSAGSLFMWSARDIGQPPIAQYTNNHTGYITNIPVIHKSVMVRVWTTGKEGTVKVWNAECSADYDPDEVLRPQLDKKKQEVCYLKERISEVEEEYKNHSMQQESRIEKLKDDVNSLQSELAEKIAALAVTKSDLATVKRENGVLESSLKRSDEKIDELARDLSIEKSKLAGISAAHQKELSNLRKDLQEREEARKAQSEARIKKLEEQAFEQQQELSRIEELRKTLDGLDYPGKRARSGSITRNVHDLIEANVKQNGRIKEMQEELDRNAAELARLRLERNKAQDEAEAVHQQLLQRKKDGTSGKKTPPASPPTQAAQYERYEPEGLEDADEDDDRHDAYEEQRRKAREEVAALEEKLARERERADAMQRENESLKRGTSLHQLVDSSKKKNAPAPTPKEHHEVPHGYEDKMEQWIYERLTDKWTYDETEEVSKELDIIDLCDADNDPIVPDRLQIRDDRLLVHDGRQVLGLDESWVVQCEDGSFKDNSGKNIDVRITDDGDIEVTELVDDEATEDMLDEVSAPRSRQRSERSEGAGTEGVEDDEDVEDGGEQGVLSQKTSDLKSASYRSQNQPASRISNRSNNAPQSQAYAENAVALGTPDGQPCFADDKGVLSWNGAPISHGGGVITYRDGEGRPQDEEGREVVGVTDEGAAIVLGKNGPTVLVVSSTGVPLQSHDNRQVVEPLGGRPQLEDGTVVVLDPTGRPVYNNEGYVAVGGEDNVVVGPDGGPVIGPDGNTPASVSLEGQPLDADGPLRVLALPDNTMVATLIPGTAVTGNDGRVLTGVTSPVPVTVGPDGYSLIGPDGKMVSGPDGMPVSVGAQGHPEAPPGEGVDIIVTPEGRAVVKDLNQPVALGSRYGSSAMNAVPSDSGRQGANLLEQNNHLNAKVRELATSLEDAHDQLDRMRQDLEVEKELSGSLKAKVDILSKSYGEDTKDSQVAALQKELAHMAAQSARRDDDMVRREAEHKDQLEQELNRKLALIEQERQEEVNRFRDMVDRRDESLRLFNEKQRGMLSHIKQLEDNIHRASQEQASLWEKNKNPSQLPTNELIYYYKYKEEQYAKIGGLNQQLHEENAALMGQTQALTEKLHALSFVIESRPSLLKVLYDLYKMCVHAKKTIEKFSKEVSTRERSRRELLDNIGGIRTEVVDVMNGEKWLIANMFTEYELLHLGTSPSFFVPDGKRFSKYKPSAFHKATGTGRWTRTSVGTPRGPAESPRTTTPAEFYAGRPASPPREFRHSHEYGY
eukprot:TRINITY_DN32357_c0_g1_i1.p1 TRINITY_DN32357_c0_g1~~TRINITY_DN32357_c0_g1_i1.p1  ORF type:complete len:1690 (+),score=748.32 TRINITY_DN32357_c0_g1_i1:442-5070(+)